MLSPNYTELVLASRDEFNLSRAGVLLDYPAVLAILVILVRNHHDSWAATPATISRNPRNLRSAQKMLIRARGTKFMIHNNAGFFL